MDNSDPDELSGFVSLEDVQARVEDIFSEVEHRVISRENEDGSVEFVVELMPQFPVEYINVDLLVDPEYPRIYP